MNTNGIAAQRVTLIVKYIPLQDPFGGPNYFTLDRDAPLLSCLSEPLANSRREIEYISKYPAFLQPHPKRRAEKEQ